MMPYSSIDEGGELCAYALLAANRIPSATIFLFKQYSLNVNEIFPMNCRATRFGQSNEVRASRRVVFTF
jgi:hypothetical protein